MAAEAKDKKPKDAKAGGGKEAKGVSAGKWSAYDATGSGLVRKRKSCPKCGEGVFMARHKDRESCGKCGYTEFQKKQ